MQRKGVVVVDSQTAGISGDMFLSALVDLGAEAKAVVEAAQGSRDYVVGCRRLKVSFAIVVRNGFRGRALQVESEEDVHLTASMILEAVKRRVADLGLS